MNNSGIIDILELVKRLPNSPITGKESLFEVARLFHAVLEDLPDEMVKAATVQYLSEGNPFFPTPGTLRDKAMDLQMLALGIPTPAEAWGMVLTAQKPSHPVFCEQGAALRDEAIQNPNAETLKACQKHDRNCEICNNGGSDEVRNYGGFRETYTHPAVAETVRLLGGRDVILTDHPTADRARFIEAYREVIARERTRMAMTPKVAEFVENSRPLVMDTGEKKFLEAQTRELTKRLTK